MTHQLYIEGDNELDLARVPHEIVNALDAETILVDQLTQGLSMRPENGYVVVISAEGQELCEIRLHRLRAVSREMLEAAVTEDEPPERVDEILAAIRDGRVTAPPDGEYVNIALSGSLLRVHRCAVVPGWPDDDPPPLETRVHRR